MRRLACPGSYDPVTNGHVEIIGRAAGLADGVVVLLGRNPGKATMFSLDERVAMLTESLAGLAAVSVATFDGLLVDYCRTQRITAIVKGVRGPADLEYEAPMAQMNATLSGIDTIFLLAREFRHVSSSLVKEVATYGGDVRSLVPPPVNATLVARLRSGVRGQ